MKFRKKLTEIDAFQLDEAFFKPFVKAKDKAKAFKPKALPDGSVSITRDYQVKVSDAMYIVVKEESHTLYVATPTGYIPAAIGDWIITSAGGSLSVCKAVIFDAIYEAI